MSPKLVIATLAACFASVASAQSLSNGSFETDGSGFLIFADWQNFGNVFAADSGETAPLDGAQMAKMFGASSGMQSDQVLQQTVTGITEGMQYTLTSNVKHITGDELGEENIILIQMVFQDGSGNDLDVVETIALDPVNDPLDTWIQTDLSGIAPTGSSQILISLLHIQLGTDAGFPTQGGGASFWDDVSLVEGDGPCMNPADLNGDGSVDFTDVNIFVDGFQQGCP